jgi:hypothetical protein
MDLVEPLTKSETTLYLIARSFISSRELAVAGKHYDIHIISAILVERPRIAGSLADQNF